MPQAFDYRSLAQDPVAALQSGMAFGQQQRANEQGMQLAQADEGRAQEAFAQQQVLFRQQQQDRAAAMESQMAQNADLGVLSGKLASGTGTYDDIAALTAKYPDLQASLGEVWTGLSDDRKKADTAELVKGIIAIKSGRPDLAIQMLEDRAAAAENSGDKQEADLARGMAAAIRGNPDAGLTSFGLLLQVADPDAAKTVFGNGRRVQSTNAYANGTTVTVFDDGTKEVTDAAGTVISGPGVQAAVDTAIASEAQMRGANAGAAETAKLDAKIEKSGTAAATEESGKQAIAKSGEAFDSLNKAKANIANVNTAIDALDRGASAGAIAKYFPNITEASASLENAMNRLGLDVIGSVTFGALSEGEMKLAMETAVPRNLNEKDLRQWLSDKKAAQEKAADALRAAAIYLGTPGNTLAGWLKSNPSSGSGSQGAADAPSASSSGDPVFDALMKEALAP